MASKLFMLSVYRMIALWCSLILTVYKVGGLLKSWNWTLIEHEPSLLLKKNRSSQTLWVFYYSNWHYQNLRFKITFLSTHWLYSISIEVLGFVQTIMYSFSTIECLLLLYVTWIRPKMEYASFAWNSVISTETKKLEHIKWKFVFLNQTIYNDTSTSKVPCPSYEKIILWCTVH
jgi:hypothetical protein